MKGGNPTSTTRKLVYPHPSTWRGPAPPASDLHETAGLGNNWALDFMAPGGTRVLAVEASTIWKLSGHDPALGVRDGDIFGWNVYLHTRDGLIYFYTHLGEVDVNTGQKVRKGQRLGVVGHWPGDPGRSHTHLGVTHPMGIQASKRAILNVAKAPRVKGTA